MEWLALPFVVALILLVVSPWTDRKGWTRVRGNATRAAASVLEGTNAWYMGHQNAVEYRKEVHDEEDGQGGRPNRRFFPGVHDGAGLAVRSLQQTPGDIANLARWLSDERVLAHYEGRDKPFDEAKVLQVFYDEFPDHEVPCMVEWEGRPIGYLQFYPLDKESRATYGYTEEQAVFGMDQFIGEPALWNKGLGSRMLRLMLAYLFEMEGARAVVVDPITPNERAIRAYGKCGFRKVKLLPGYAEHEGTLCDAWLMEVTPETVQPATQEFYLRW